MSACVPSSRVLLIATTHHFLLVALYGLQLGERGPLAVGISGSSSILRAVNLFCSCKFLGGAGVFLLVLEVIDFHPSPSPEVLLTLTVGVDTTYFSIAGGD